MISDFLYTVLISYRQVVTGDPVVDTGTAVSIVDDPAAVVGEAEAGGNIVCMVMIIITMLTPP